MARNAIESYLRTSKMAASGHFVKKFKKKFRMDLKWPEMPSKVNFGHPKWPINLKSEMARNAIQSEMARNAIQSDLQTSKMAAGKKILYRSEMARNAKKNLY